MKVSAFLPVLAAVWMGGCSRPAEAPVAKSAAAPAPVRITQFYATNPTLPRGEKELLCYGVENAKTVWLSPPRQELSASPSRCVEVTPASTTAYTLTAEGASGPSATQEVTVTVGAARVHIIEVKVSSLQVKAGDQVNFCYKVENAKSVEIQPIHFQGGARPNACVMTAPQTTTTYVVTATGAAGDQDQEKVTIKVGPG